MRVVATALPGLLVIERDIFADRRGAFHEAFQARGFAAAGLPETFAQISDSHSKCGVLRGLHLQRPVAQAKLVRVVTGRIYDVVVDLRPDSATCGRWAPFTLAADENRMLFIQEGFAHGFVSLSDSVVVYHLTAPYDPAGQITIAWNDPELAIEWPVVEPIVSAADAAGMTLAEFKRQFLRPEVSRLQDVG
jgi:dTDP-4-dehydrorhamnose 3,5-epimerase